MTKLGSETRIVVGRVAEPGDPAQPWWWQSSTTIQGAEVTVAGYAATESDALLMATATTLDLQAAYGGAREPAAPVAHERPRPTEVEIWAGNGSSAANDASEPADREFEPSGAPNTGN